MRGATNKDVATVLWKMAEDYKSEAVKLDSRKSPDSGACYRVGVVWNAQQGSRDHHPGISFALWPAAHAGWKFANYENQLATAFRARTRDSGY